jgi:hypothetical protein
MDAMDNDIVPAKRPRKSVQIPTDTSKANKQPESTETEAFRTPEEVAAEQTLQAASSATRQTAVSDPPKRAGGGWRQRLALHWPPGKKEWIVAVVIVLLGGLGSFLVITHHHKPVVATTKPAKLKPAKPKTVASNLSGLQVDPSLNKLPVTGVMIENSTDARPQAGLSQAMVVFEAVAEGGVTRFLALYQDTSPANVGPIRSARPYYVQWALGFDAGYAHVGGSPDALADIKAWGVRDLDQFANGSYYQRITTRAAPHNVYTSIAKLNQLEDSKGYTSSTFTSFPRKKEAPTKQPPTAKTIDLTLSGPLYNAHYDYNAATNSYNRSEAGAPHIDANTNTQISPKVVIAMVIPESNGALDASGAYYSDYASIGSGQVYVFQDGTVTTGQWTKSGNASQITFTNASGQPISLNPGQTWLTAVSATTKVSYSP